MFFNEILYCVCHWRGLPPGVSGGALRVAFERSFVQPLNTADALQKDSPSTAVCETFLLHPQEAPGAEAIFHITRRLLIFPATRSPRLHLQ